MSLETGTYISDLNSANPVGTDVKSQGDDHIRLVKSTILATFPNVTGAITPTHTDLNQLLNAGSHAGMLNDIGLLDDPLADRLLFWDESAGAAGLLSLTTGLSLVGTSLGIDTSVVPQLGAANTFASSLPVLALNNTNGLSTDRAYLQFESAGTIEGYVGIGDLLTGGRGDFNIRLTSGSLLFSGDNGATLHLNAGASGLAWGGGSTIDSSSHVALLDTAQSFTANQTLSAASKLVLRDSTDTYYCNIYRDGTYTYINPSAGTIKLSSHAWITGNLEVDGTLTTPNSSASEVGFKGAPRVTSSPAQGDCYAVSAGFTLATGLAAGMCYSVYNDSASSITITQGSGLTLRLSGTSTTGNRTLAARGMAYIWANSTTEYIISGAVS